MAVRLECLGRRIFGAMPGSAPMRSSSPAGPGSSEAISSTPRRAGRRVSSSTLPRWPESTWPVARLPSTSWRADVSEDDSRDSSSPATASSTWRRWRHVPSSSSRRLLRDERDAPSVSSRPPARAAPRFVYAASSSCYGIPETYPHLGGGAGRPAVPVRADQAAGRAAPPALARCTASPRSRCVQRLRAALAHQRRLRRGLRRLPRPEAQRAGRSPWSATASRPATSPTSRTSPTALLTAASPTLGRDFNIATAPPQSVNRLVELLGGGEVVHLPKRPGEPDCTGAESPGPATSSAGSPGEFEDGVARMLEHLDDWREAPVWTAETIEAATGWFAHLSDSVDRPQGREPRDSRIARACAKTASRSSRPTASSTPAPGQSITSRRPARWAPTGGHDHRGQHDQQGPGRPIFSHECG